MLGPILVRIGHDHASRSPGYPWALLQAVVDLQAVVNVADLHERRSCRVSAAFAVLRHKVSHVLADPQQMVVASSSLKRLTGLLTEPLHVSNSRLVAARGSC